MRTARLPLAQVVPQLEEGRKSDSGSANRACIVGGLRARRAAPAGRDGQRRRDDQHLAGAAVAAASRIIRPSRGSTGSRAQLAPVSVSRGRPRPGSPAGERAEFLQQPDAVGDVPRVGRVDEREVGHVAQVQRGHLQDDRGQVGAQDLRVGELGGWRSPPRCTAGCTRRPRYGRIGPCAGRRRLRDRLDGQPLDLGALAVAGDPRGARVDDVTDPRDGQRGLGDVGGQHHPTGIGTRLARVGSKTRCCSAADSRAYSGSTSRPSCPASASAVSRISRSPLRNTRMSPGPTALQLGDRVEDALDLVLRLLLRVVGVGQRPVPHLDRVGPPGHLDRWGPRSLAWRRRQNGRRTGPGRWSPR